MSAANRRLVLKALWNLRGLSLFLIGPVIGVLLGAQIFGMPQTLQIAATIMFMFSLGIFIVLFRGEWRRLLDEQSAS